MELVAGRRLTGPNLYDPRPGAIVEVGFPPGESAESVQRAIASWQGTLERGLAALGWRATVHTRVYPSRRGADLMFTSDPAHLYAAVDLAEWALGDGDPAELASIAGNAAAETAARRACLELIARAEREAVAWMIDDEYFSVGLGRYSTTWRLADAPPPAAVDWDRAGHRVPIALITGTNGKTTCARLLARVAAHAGFRVGHTSTDGIFVGDRLVDAGDWTGPGGARTLLRRLEIDCAVLEVARGGLLRRGLGVQRADAALITNVSEDHLGDFGVDSLAELARVKGIVARAIPASGRVVLGADSPPLVDWSRASRLAAPRVWFAVDADHEVLVAHRRTGGEVWTVVDEQVCRLEGERVEPLLGLADIPLTFAGRARHNVANVLAVAALAHALGFARPATVAALRDFGSTPADNPGRARTCTIPVADGEVELLLDFAHNRAGFDSIAEFVLGLGRPILVTFGMAGDRSDEQLRALGAALTAFHPRRVVLREQVEYLRGRERGVVPRVLGEGLTSVDFPREAIAFADNEPDALRLALAAARPGELIVHLVHTDRSGVDAWLREVGAGPSPFVGAPLSAAPVGP